jgi:hypothetical protein
MLVAGWMIESPEALPPLLKSFIAACECLRSAIMAPVFHSPERDWPDQQWWSKPGHGRSHYHNLGEVMKHRPATEP